MATSQESGPTTPFGEALYDWATIRSEQPLAEASAFLGIYSTSTLLPSAFKP
jgi:hypothetical protein